MKVAIEEFSNRLSSCAKDSLPKIVLINGNEPLLVEEALDAARKILREAGFAERVKYQVETGFDWSSLTEVGQAMSLFAESRLLELRVPKSLGAPGTKAILEYCNQLPQEDILIIIMPLLDKRQRSAKWFKTLDSVAWIVDGYDLSTQQFPVWIRHRFQSRALRVEAGVVETLAEQTEGNLLAAAQEIDKLQVLAPDGAVTMELMERSLADQAKFDVYALVDTLLLGNLTKGLRILSRLQSEGVEPVIIVWALVREVRMLAAISASQQMGHSRGQLFKQHRVWSRRERIVSAALDRLTPKTCSFLLERAAHLDQSVKGQRYLDVGDVWFQIEQIGTVICGVDPCAIAEIGNTSH